MKSRRKQSSNNLGFTLVEIICAVAIFAMVMAAMGSIMVYTSKSYTKGSQETEIQQEAQFAANRIGGIVQDANKVTYAPGILTMDDGVSVHTVSHNTSTHELMYAMSSGGSSSGEQLLANNVTSFDADVTDFDKTKTVKLNITVNDNGREYQMSYNMKARNEAAKTGTATIVKTASIIAEPKLVLVPGKPYTIYPTVKGTTAGISAISSGLGVSVGADDSVTIDVPVNAAKTGDSVFYVYLSTNELGDTGLPLATSKITVQIRRVNEVEVHHSVDTSLGEEGMAGAEYKFYSNITKKTPYLAKVLGVSWENNYKNPYAVEWSHEFTINGSAGIFNMYFEEVDKQEDVDKPTITYRLTKDLPSGAKFTVKAKSKHAAGVNKANSNYATVIGEDSIEAGTTTVTSSTNTVVMEPMQKLELPVTLSGGASTIVCDLSGNSDSSTKAEYSNLSKKVTIVLGKNEKGNSSDAFKVSVHPSGNTSNKFDITVKVRRVEDITIDYNRESGDDLVQGAVYRFYTSYTGTDYLNKLSKAEEVSDYVNAFATEFSWEYKVGSLIKSEKAEIHNTYNNADGESVYTGSVTDEYIEILSTGVSGYRPYIKVRLKKSMPANSEFTMKAKALHPLGTYAGAKFNKDGKEYATGIEDSCKLQREGIMASTKDGKVIVEPGQGIGKDVSGAFAIPIYVSSPIYSIDAQLTGNKSSDTSLWLAETGSGYGHKLNNELWYIKMKVGVDETGNNGKMSLKLSAKDSSGHVIETEEITVCLRRVTEVKVVSEQEIVNKVGSTIKLSAQAKGYGKDGTEYFEQYTEKDAGGNQPIWDRDDYVSPYPMEWTVVANGTEKPLASYATITSTTYDSAKNQKYSNGNHEIEFTLATALPNGSKIRATSRHAGGENKSGKVYDDVYGEIEVKGDGGGTGPTTTSESAPFARGEEYFFPGESVEDILPLARDIEQHKGGSVKANYFFRVCDKTTGQWTPYVATKEAGNPQKLCAIESQILLPDRAYDIDIIRVVVDHDKKLIYWPKDEAIKAAGSGFDDYQFAESGEDETPYMNLPYRHLYFIDRSKPVFKNSDGSTSYNKGSKSSPIVLSSQDSYKEINIDDVIDLNMGKPGTNMRNELKPQAIQKWNGSGWDIVNTSEIFDQNNSCGFYIPQYDNASFKIQYSNSNNKGIYRIGVGINAKNFQYIEGKLLNVVYKQITSPSEFALYSEDEDTGFIYIEIE